MRDSESREETGDDAAPTGLTKWLARVLCWLCWLGIGISSIDLVMGFLNLHPAPSEPPIPRSTGLIESRVTIPNDPTLAGLRADWINRIAGLVPSLLFMWALLSARRSFAGISEGAYFARPTVLGLRNFALAVLLYLTAAPVIIALARVHYASQFKGAVATFSLQVSTQIQLSIMFPLAVALISTLIARAARIADENRQFV